ncbi:MAG: AAA family ATPase [Anaerovoracaceae bacterium]|nr:AAA family ATPase [Anaerovoracaceae bacterium]
MGTYLGKINIIGRFYNFTPLYEITETGVKALSSNDYDRILPESQKRNINFSYDTYVTEEVNFMDYHCRVDLPLVFEFELADLEVNYTKSGDINQTGYRIRTVDQYNLGRLKEPNAAGIYQLISQSEISSDPMKDNIIEFNAEHLYEGTNVFIRLDSEDMVIGPYHVEFRERDQSYYALSKLKENKYVLSGYSKNACTNLLIDTEYGEVLYFMPNKGASRKYLDVIDDRMLLDGFRQNISSDLIIDGRIDFSDIDRVIDSFQKSPFFMGVEDVSIRRKRLQKITTLLEVPDEIDDSIKYIAEVIGDSLTELIEKYEGSESVDKLLNTIIAANPRLINNIPQYKVVKKSIDELEARKEELQYEVNNIEQDTVDLKRNSEKELLSLFKSDDSERIEINEDINRIREEKKKLEEEVYELQEKLGLEKDLLDIEERINKADAAKEYFNRQIDHLRGTADSLDLKLKIALSSVNDKIADMYIDELVASKLQEAAGDWKRRGQKESFESLVDGMNSVDCVDMEPTELIDYLFDVIKDVRPQYDKNTLINIMTCVCQNMLTVLSGTPGCGKTSICNIIAQALGLNDFIEPKRYVSVSVERGWTSKRDFIGYYNPLTQSFDQNNKKVYDALKILDNEDRNGINKFPFIILLDEANLSPMEYYWADFMNVCDDLSFSNEINIGEENIFKIPPTLHFMATINNDHTTETLSPRLIDRSAVITLPKVSNIKINAGIIDNSKLQHVSWKSLERAFVNTEEDEIASNELESLLKDIRTALRSQNEYMSPRREITFRHYYNVTSRLFNKNVDELGREPYIIAMDYAVAQFVLPKINGYGEGYKEWLEKLKELCNNKMLTFSEDIISSILQRGEKNMNNYQFFS